MSFFSSHSALGAGDYNTQADDLIYDNIVTPLQGEGWSVITHFPYVKIVQNSDMSPFSGFSSSVIFWAVYPFDYPTHDALVVMDYTGSVSMPPGFQLFAQTGTTNAAMVHPFIVQAFQQCGSAFGGFTPIGSDPTDSRPNTILKATVPTTPLLQNITLPIIGIALNSNNSACLNGGYALTSPANGASQTSFFVGRRGDIGNTGPISFLAAESYTDNMFLFNLSVGSGRTDWVDIDLVNMDWVIAGHPHRCLISQSSSSKKAHVESIAVTAPERNGLFRADFQVFSPSSSIGLTGFRHYTNCSGNARLSINGGVAYINAQGKHNPMLLTDWPANNDETLWENGSTEITEPWVGYSLVSGQPAGLVGKIPGAVLANGKLPFGTQFLHDNKRYLSYTEDAAQDSNGRLGTLCLEIPVM